MPLLVPRGDLLARGVVGLPASRLSRGVDGLLLPLRLVSALLVDGRLELVPDGAGLRPRWGNTFLCSSYNHGIHL